MPAGGEERQLPGRRIARVPEGVRYTAWDEDERAGRRDALLAVDQERHLAVQHVERLIPAPVDVQGRTRGARRARKLVGGDRAAGRTALARQSNDHSAALILVALALP